MAYKDFTFTRIEDDFKIRQRTKKLFSDDVSIVMPSDWLLETLKRFSQGPLTTEKAVSEALVFPVLQEIKFNNPTKIELFSGEVLESDKKLKLNGECDFILSLSPQSRELKAPLLSVLEAKKADIESARNQAQNAAQLIGARFFNEKRNVHLPLLYGACTNGFEWVFLMLEHDTIFVDTDRYALQNLPKLLGVLDCIVNTGFIVPQP